MGEFELDIIQSSHVHQVAQWLFLSQILKSYGEHYLVVTWQWKIPEKIKKWNLSQENHRTFYRPWLPLHAM